jgi:hypothetical protein
MIKNFYLFLLFVISYEQVTIPNYSNPTNIASTFMYLPMKKDHKFGDDICYYREYDDKLKYFIYYVKPCEVGKYCQYEISAQPFGYCVDIQSSPATISKWKESCESDVDCQSGLTCENSECKDTRTCPNEIYQSGAVTFDCLNTNEKIDNNYCEKYEYETDSNNAPYNPTISYGNYPGLSNYCGLVHYKPFNYKYSSSGQLVDDVQYKVESKEWCSIGSVPDNEFVTNSDYCYSGFTLEFYPNKLYKNPSKFQSQTLAKLCVTPISIDIKNKLANDDCIITYKILDGSPKQYNSDLGSGVTCSYTTIIESERHREFADAFKEASDEDKRNCYNIDTYKYNCKNSKLIKLWYFKKYPEDYLFYKDRDKLKAVLDFKIQRKYPTYSFTKYLNCSYLLFLLFLILM